MADSNTAPFSHVTFHVNICKHLETQALISQLYSCIHSKTLDLLELFQNGDLIHNTFEEDSLPLARGSSITDLFVNSTSIELNQYMSEYSNNPRKIFIGSFGKGVKYCSLRIQIFQQGQAG